MAVASEEREVLVRFCAGLKQLREDAGLPLGEFSDRMNLALQGRTLSPGRANEIERGVKIRKAPDWSLVAAWVGVCHTAARERRRPVSVTTDPAFWKAEHSRLTEELERAKPSGGSGHQVPRQLGPAPTHFTGREHEVRLLANLLAAQGTLPQHATGMVVVSGMAGVGKTGLVLHWSHTASPQFPDGQLFRDLRGYAPDEKPLSPSEVLADWLKDVWGVDRVPDGLDARVSLFRSRIAGKRMLLVLDNAVTADQVRPLLPATESCFVIVTSRDRLDGLLAEGASPMSLGLLSPTEAKALLRKVIGERVDADEPAAAALAKLCAYLPLALRVAGSRAAADPDVSVAALVRQLADERRRLRRLGNPDDPRTNVRAVFSWSYRGLPEEAQRMFRLLSLHPAAGHTAEPFTIAALVGVDIDTAAEQIDLLRRRFLVTGANGRVGMHDLLRLYARELLEQQESTSDSRVALDRLVHAYYGCVNHAFDRQNHNNPMVDADYLRSWRERDPAGVEAVDAASSPTGWFAAEHANLVALVQAAAEAELEPTPRLATSLFYFLEIGSHLADWHRVEEIASRMATARSDRARSLRNRGRLAMIGVLAEQERLRDEDDARPAPPEACDQAISLLERSRDLYHAEYLEHGRRQDRAGEGTTLRELADAYRLEVDPTAPGRTIRKAIEAYQAAEEVYAELGNENGLASLRLALGMAYAINGQFGEAEQCFRASLAYGGLLNDQGRARHGRLKGFSLRRLADLHRDQGQLGSAVGFYNECVEAFLQDVNDPVSRARALAARGRVQDELGDGAAGRHSLVEAYDLLTRRPLGVDDPEAKVVASWLSRLDSDA
ncbi:NB-ARC domain-containing protein [Crossiella sp. CA198]|uniref:NB-ARC domain-containing protein n=1 Tax=Crossiella sp. CA198 TaxID=3455607 RepID=UPI003F8D6A94